MKKSILIYGLSSFEPDKETLVVGSAVEELGYSPVIVIDKPSQRLQERFEHVYINQQWSMEILRSIAQKHDVCLALLLTDFASPLIGQLNDELNLPGPGASSYNQVSDKINWYNLAIENGLPMPEQLVVSNHDELDRFDWDFPFMVKPSKSAANISFQPFGYEYFDNAKTFKAFLKKNNLIDTFITCNQSPSVLGRYFFQERVEHSWWNNGLGSMVGNKFYFHEMHTSLFYPFPHHKNYYATYGPLEVTEKQKAHIEVMGGIFEGIGMKNTGISFDIVVANDGNIYTLDINARSGGTFTIMGPPRGVHYFCNLIEGILQGNFSVPKNLKPFLRHTVILEPGNIRDIQWRRPLPEGMFVTGYEQFKWPVQHNKYMGRFQWPLEAVVVEESLDQCFQKYNEFSKSLEITYEKPSKSPSL